MNWPYLTIFAQTAIETAGPYTMSALVGGLITWLCTSLTKRMDRVEHALKDVGAAIWMDLANRNTLPPIAQKKADDMVAKMGARLDRE